MLKVERAVEPLNPSHTTKLSTRIEEENYLLPTFLTHQSARVCLSQQFSQGLNSSSQSKSMTEQKDKSDYHTRIFLSPALLPFIPFQQLVRWNEICREHAFVISNYAVDIGYYEAICTSFAGQYGIYVPRVLSPKTYFFNHIWTSRMKWAGDEEQQNFNIRVSSRFSPGVRSNEKIELPLHQFLAVRRKQLKETEKGQAVFVGEATPERYLDPLMGTIMNEPVLLESSNKIVDKSVALSCVLRGGRDPFNNSRLDFNMLSPMRELAEEIKEFKVKQEKCDVGVDTNDAMLLAKHLDPAVVEALVAAEQLECASKRVAYDEWEQHNNLQITGQQNFQNNINGVEQNQEENPENDQANAEIYGLEVPPNFNHGIIYNNENEVREEEETKDSKIIRSSDDFGAGPRWRKDRCDTTARILDTSSEKSCVTMHVPGSGVRPYHFNNVFTQHSSQKHVYDQSTQDLITSAINGRNSCILCYGQTGSGKTYTMFGPDDICSDMGKVLDECKGNSEVQTMENIISNEHSAGIVFRSFAELLRAKFLMEKFGKIRIDYQVQFVEVYKEVVTDLISGKRLSVHRNNGQLSGAISTKVDCIESVINLLNEGHSRKHFASTAMNERSSRSHTAIIIQISQTFKCNTETKDRFISSQLYLVDLAGSERVKKSKAMGNQLVEAKSINTSLLVLGKVINRLSRSDIHVPYFESKLTTMLKGAFGGDSKTGVIVTCRSDDKIHGDETLHSLRFGQRCGMISNASKQAASCTVEELIKNLDNSIDKFTGQLDSLKARGKQNLPSYRSLESKLQELKCRRNDIASVPK